MSRLLSEHSPVQGAVVNVKLTVTDYVLVWRYFNCRRDSLGVMSEFFRLASGRTDGST